MQFKSLKSRIAFIFLTLILVIQIIGSLAIRSSIQKNARASVNTSLEIGEKIFLNLLEQNGENLTQGARILATDYGFRQAIGSNDSGTILSALENHQGRIGASIAMYCSPTGDNIVTAGNVSKEEATSELASLIKNTQANGDGRQFRIISSRTYQLVAVPVKAPLTIGWIVMGFEIDSALAKKLNKLTNLEVTFISKAEDKIKLGNRVLKGESELSVSQSGLVAKAFNSEVKVSEVKIGNAAFGTRIVPIFSDGHQSLSVELQSSIDMAMQPYKTLEKNLFILTLIGALIFSAAIFYVAKRISLPIAELADKAKKLENGDYNIAIESKRIDEIGKLGRAFNSMSEAISSREKSILKLAYWDEMTQLPNRAAFMQQIKLLIEESGHEPVIVIVMNLDRFKQINNVLGHGVANEILRIVARRIETSASNPYSPISQSHVARLGGDEFAIILTKTSHELMLKIVNNLVKYLESPVEVAEQLVDITASIGVASYPDHAENYEQLLAHAEIAMHIAKTKQSGIVIFEPQFDVTSKVNLSLASDLKHAIAEHHFQLFVQPKVNLGTGEVCSVEALIRWLHPEKGFIFPDQFIPFAEQTGYIQKISMLMLNLAAGYSAHWQAQGIFLPIAVNLSTRDLIDQNLPNKIASILKTHHLNTDALTLEITEGTIMEDPLRALETLEELSKMGFKLSIDDFGTGYSSLAYLKKLPVDELKIDKSFVLNMSQDRDDIKIVRSTIDLAHNFNLKVVAEGIENMEAWDLLKYLGCDFGQGYFISRPMPGDKFVSWLNNWKVSQEKNAA
ncbi:MAG: EAL domain-containing protein [Methylophilaceae bacterium]|nr:EAL domain-containing protein [Methylophilaceae bacterium]